MTFERDWTSSPGGTLRDWMDETTMTAEEIAENGGLTLTDVADVLNRRPYGRRVAVGLSAATGISVTFWLALETQYREDLAKGRVDIDA